ncbi:histidine phosphatase family protein [Streptacidiphilus jiangxiensis]|uniref:Broad specificity phosphatase PhoE n=1 Tax=Streptacidiphilus jiangxiensis TaxID=235985 RepID=A0A1H7G2Y4_STRJI|nr:histidine phosphatase family protein [Streptacidiphilus jiangxiensis]SEK31152.1 Broad specificity phosphatase PhoE [Streptacidiphilus jiangxiensis]
MALTDQAPTERDAGALRTAPRRLFPALPGPLSLTAVRHGQSTANAAFHEAEAVGALDVGISCRDADLSLTSLGREEARALGRWLATRSGDGLPHSLWVSPYLRTQETAALVVEELDRAGLPLPELCTDERLRDRELGLLEMLTSAAIELRHPEEAARRRLLGELRWRPPGGESYSDVALRVRSALRDLYEAEPDRRVLVVAHDAVVMLLRHVIDDLQEGELTDLARGGAVANTSVTRWVRDAKGALTLDCWNIRPHLA